MDTRQNTSQHQATCHQYETIFYVTYEEGLALPAFILKKLSASQPTNWENSNSTRAIPTLGIDTKFYFNCYQYQDGFYCRAGNICFQLDSTCTQILKRIKESTNALQRKIGAARQKFSRKNVKTIYDSKVSTSLSYFLCNQTILGPLLPE